jgi:hypothetical protein
MSCFTRIAMAALAALLVSNPAAAQGAAPNPLDRLDFLMGSWSGTGVMTRGPQRSEAQVTERAERVAGGGAVTLHGLGTIQPSGESAPRTVHDAYAVIWYDAALARYEMFAIRAGGVPIRTQPTVEENRLVWGFDDPRAGHIRFTVTRTPAGEWQEVGERSADGADWTSFFEMTLRRTGA